MVDNTNNVQRKSQRSGLRTSYKDVDFCSEYNQISESESAASIQINVCKTRKLLLKKQGKFQQSVKKNSNWNVIPENYVMHNGGGNKKRKRNTALGSSSVSSNNINVSEVNVSTVDQRVCGGKISSSNFVTNTSRIMFDSRILDDCGVEQSGLEQANMSYFCGGEAQREGERCSDGMCVVFVFV